MTTGTIAVLGIGGVGGMIAARTGAVCVGTPRTVDAIRGNGLTLTCGDVTTVTRVEAVEALTESVSLLVVAVKAPDLDVALERIDPGSIAGAVVLPLLNGLEHVDTLRERLGGAPGVTLAARPPVVVAGAIGRLEAFSPEPGFVVQRTPGALVTAASRDLSKGALEVALAPLRAPGIEVDVLEDERTVLWEKAARLAVLAAATSASGEPIGVLRSDPDWRARLDLALREACGVARADGARVDPTVQWAIIEEMPGALTTSTARDVAVGRPSELDAITGSVVRAGRRLGVATPGLEALLEDACRPR